MNSEFTEKIFDFYKNSSEKKKDLLVLSVLIIIALFIIPFPSEGVMGRDETSYAFLMKHFVDGTFLSDYIFIAFHPLFSFLGSFFVYFGMEPEIAGKTLNYILCTLSLVPIYLSGKMLFSRNVGFIAGLMTITFTGFTQWAAIVQAQITYAFMLFMSQLFMVLLFIRKKAIFAVLGGMFISLAYLSRAEGLGIFAGWIAVFIIYILIKKEDVKKHLLALSLFIASFLIVATPYVYALRLITGETKFTDKLFTQIRVATIVTYGYDYEKFNYGNIDLPKLTWIKLALKAYPGKIIEFLKNTPELYNWLPLILFIFALFIMFFKKKDRLKLIFFFPYLYVVFIIPFFFLTPNFYQPYAPILFIMSSYGLVELKKLLEEKFSPKKGLIIFSIFFSLLCYEHLLHSKIKTFFYPPPPETNIQSIVYQSYRDFGKLIKPIIKPGDRIMTRYNIVAYYAGGEYVVFPDVSWHEFLNNLDNQKVNYIIIGPEEQDIRAEISFEILNRVITHHQDARFQLVRTDLLADSMIFSLIRVNK